MDVYFSDHAVKRYRQRVGTDMHIRRQTTVQQLTGIARRKARLEGRQFSFEEGGVRFVGTKLTGTKDAYLVRTVLVDGYSRGWYHIFKYKLKYKLINILRDW